LTTGRIDLAYRTNGEWTVVEFKTAGLSDPTRALEVYGPQLAAYRRAFSAATGAPVRAALCLLATGRLLPLDAS
jgi:ATP-dependent exoDNAse (exonuclease V) beta subunit